MTFKIYIYIYIYNELEKKNYNFFKKVMLELKVSCITPCHSLKNLIYETHMQLLIKPHIFYFEFFQNQTKYIIYF